MEAVVLVGKIANRPVRASQALPAAHEGGRNGYLIIIINGITVNLPVLCKQLKLATLLCPTLGNVLY